MVMVGKVVRNSALMALANKESGVGENRDLCWNSIRSAIVGASMMEFREWHLVLSMVQSLLGCLLPWRMSLLL